MLITLQITTDMFMIQIYISPRLGSEHSPVFVKIYLCQLSGKPRGQMQCLVNSLSLGLG